MLVVESERHAGNVYKFHKKNDKLFSCASCKVLGKCRSITVIDGRIVGKKHPEDDHHPECKPVPKEFIDVLEIDRGMRSEVRRTGKRPREAFTEAVTSIAKKFKSSAEQKLGNSTVSDVFPSTGSPVPSSLKSLRSCSGCMRHPG